MPVDADLRSLDIDVPARPDALVRMSLLLADEEINLVAVGSLVESDMALAAAVMKAVNSSLYGLKGRVNSVHQAVTYLGTREVAGITFEMGLRAAFASSPDLEPIWTRAGQRGLIMGRLGEALGLDAWAAHSAGLFEECGKAVLYRHAPDHYPAMLRAAASDVELREIERMGFGVCHDVLGAALCDSWGLSAVAVACVRQHIEAQTQQRIEGPAPRRQVLALSVLAHAMMRHPDQLDALAEALAPRADLDGAAVLRVARRLQATLAQNAEHGR
ncbi:MAG: HDOD domain-containing protein [Ideonella sp.]|nr:HDOD domain-containing protein [Ideonella sp.]MBL0149913.1 HDOD domain-containing protein [Ideonella sp.]